MIVNSKYFNIVAGVDKQKFMCLSQDEIDKIIPAACHLKNKFITMHGMFKQFPELSSGEPERLPLETITNAVLNSIKIEPSQENAVPVGPNTKKVSKVDEPVLKKLKNKEYEKFYTQSKY